MGDDHRLSTLLAEAETVGIKFRAEGGQLHITAPKVAMGTARLVALAKAAVIARLAGRSLPVGACSRCGSQPEHLVKTYWRLPICPACCRQLAEPGGEFDLTGSWPETPREWSGVREADTGGLDAPMPDSPALSGRS